MLSMELVRNTFEYNNGDLLRLTTRKASGSVNSRGYINVYLGGRLYVAHRLVFMYHYGYLPEFIDHIDGDRQNNKIENLRGTTKSCNSHNMAITKRNTSGVKGVHWCKQKNKWCARISAKGQVLYCRFFSCIIKAEESIRERRLIMHGEFARDK